MQTSTSKALLWAAFVLCFVHDGYCLCDHVIVVLISLGSTGGPLDSTLRPQQNHQGVLLAILNNYGVAACSVGCL